MRSAGHLCALRFALSSQTTYGIPAASFSHGGGSVGDTNIDVPGAGRADELGSMADAVQIFRDSIIERQRAQTELAKVNRVATMGQLTASIAQEN
jgi:hypothetical protein